MREDLIEIARRKLYRVGRYVGDNPGWRIESRFKDPNSKWMPLHGSALYTSKAKAMAALGRLMCLIEDRPLLNVKIQPARNLKYLILAALLGQAYVYDIVISCY